MKPQTYVRWTGYPPPSEQIARQVRSATGMTLGAVVGKDGPTAPWISASPARRADDRPVPLAVADDVAGDDAHASCAVRLMAVLQQLTESRAALPMIRDLASAAGLTHTMMTRTLRNLHKRGGATVWIGVDHGCRGEYAIRLPGYDHLLRSKGAPPEII